MKYIRFKELRKLIFLGRTTIWLMMRKGRFPHSRRIGKVATAWLESEVEDWIKERAQTTETVVASRNRRPAYEPARTVTSTSRNGAEEHHPVHGRERWRRQNRRHGEPCGLVHANQVPIQMLDLNTENKSRGSLAHFYDSRVPKLNIHTPAGRDGFVDHISDGAPVLLADMGSGAGQLT